MEVKLNFYRKVLPSICIDFSSTKGKKVFKDALDGGFMNIYFKLGPQIKTQDELAYCGLTSLVMVLNALSVDPGKVWKGVWRWYYEEMLECCTSLDMIKRYGATIDQISCIAKCNQLESTAIHTDEKATIELFRNNVKSICSSTDKAIIVSYGRKTLGQSGGGHLAPIGGYSEKDDLVLILDPARYKYPPYWVPISSLFNAMQTTDPVSRKPRGYLILKKITQQPTLLFHLSKKLNVLQPTDENFIHFVKEALKFLNQKIPKKVSDEYTIMIKKWIKKYTQKQDAAYT